MFDSLKKNWTEWSQQRCGFATWYKDMDDKTAFDVDMNCKIDDEVRNNETCKHAGEAWLYAPSHGTVATHMLVCEEGHGNFSDVETRHKGSFLKGLHGV